MQFKKTYISSLIAIVFVGYIISIIDFQLLNFQIHNNLEQLFIMGVLYLITQVLRLMRNYFLLWENKRISVSLLSFLPMGFVGNTISTYGPFKSGELIVTQIYNAEFDCDFNDTFAVIILGRTVDITIVLIFSVLGVFIVPSDYKMKLVISIAIIAIIVIILLSLLLNRKLGMYIVQRFERFSILGKIIRFARNYYDALSYMLNNKKSKILLFSFTISRWLVEFYIRYYLFTLFGIKLTLIQIGAILGLSYAFGVASGSPGSVGTAEFTAFAILSYLGIPPQLSATAIATGFLISALIQLVQGVGGLISARFLKIIQLRNNSTN